MRDVFKKNFGSEIGDLMHEALNKHAEAIDVIGNYDELSNYLNFELEKEKEQKINYLRLEVNWFDFALQILEGTDKIFLKYKDTIKDDAFYFLNLYYRVERKTVEKAIKTENDFKAFWHWLISQNNPLINSFLKNWKQGIAKALPIASAASLYERCSTYQQINFKFPIPEKTIVSKDVSLKFCFSFNWIENDEFSNNKYWGEIKIKSSTDENIENYINFEQKKHFFSMMNVRLINNKNETIVENIKVNAGGIFYIDKESWKIVKKALDEKTLSCELFLSTLKH